MIYLITVNFYAAELIARLLASVESSPDQPYTFIIVNNSPDDGYIHALTGETVLILEANRNLGFGAACNLGLTWVYEREPAAIAWLINPDTWLSESALTQAVDFFKAHPECSIVGTLVREPNGQVWFGGGQFQPLLGAITASDRFAAQPELDYVACDWVSGCSLLLNLQRFPVCPQFDPAYFLYYEDFDLCQRYLSQGHSVGITNRIVVTHTPSSITDRSIAFKLQHSTYSYLLTLARYSPRLTFSIRLLRLILHTLALIFVKPQVASGKLSGLWMYLRRVLHFDQLTPD